MYCGTTQKVAIHDDVRRYRRETCRSAINPRGILWSHRELKLLFGVVWLGGRVQFRSAEPPVRHAVFRRSWRLRWSVVGAAILLTSCAPAGVLDPQGPIASAERLLLINSTAIMLVVVIPVIVATLDLRSYGLVMVRAVRLICLRPRVLLGSGS